MGGGRESVTPDSDLPRQVALQLAAVGRSAVDGVRQAARDGAGQLIAWELKLAPGASRVRQLVYGLSLPLVIARAVLADARVRARWIRYGAAQAIATVVGAALLLAIGGGGESPPEGKAVDEAAQVAVAELRGRVDQRAEELARRAPEPERKLVAAEASLIDGRLERVAGKLGRSSEQALAPDELPRMLAWAVDEAALERAAARRDRIAAAAENLDAAKIAGELVVQGKRLAFGSDPSSAGPPPAPAAVPEEEQDEESVARLLEAGAKEGATTPDPEQVELARRARTELRAAALSGLPAAQQKLEAALPWSSRLARMGISWRFTAWLLALWGALYAAQLVVIALCRGYHAELSREACLLAGIAPEDPPIRPSPHLDLKWAWTRVKRYLRGWLVFTLGLPVCWLVTLPFPGDVARNVLVGAWFLYWQGVFAASKSSRAWVDELVAPAPWFIRAWRWVVEKVPFAWMLGAGAYGRLWERYTRSLYAPAECVEQQPAAFAGLTIVRLVGSLPLVKVFVRPLIPVASAVMLEAYRERHPARTAPAVLQALPVPAPAPVANAG